MNTKPRFEWMLAGVCRRVFFVSTALRPRARQGHRQRWKVWKLTRPGALVVSREGLGLASPRYTPSDKRRLSLDLGERVHPPSVCCSTATQARDRGRVQRPRRAAARRPARPQRARPARCSAERRRRTGHRRPAAIPSLSDGGGVRESRQTAPR